MCFNLSPFQAAVEVPQYVGVNLLVEGAPLRRSRPPLHRQTVFSNPSLTIQFPSDQSSSQDNETSRKPSRQNPSTVSFHVSGKENRAVGEKKRQLTSTSPKRESEGRTEVQNRSCVRKSCRSLASEQTLATHAEPQRKARRFGMSLGANGVTLVPRSLSFAPSPPPSTSHCKSMPSTGHRSHVSRSFLPPTAFEPQHRTSTGVFPSLRGPLPSLEVFSLRPNIVVGTIACRNPNVSSHPSIPRHQFSSVLKGRTWPNTKEEHRQ